MFYVLLRNILNISILSKTMFRSVCKSYRFLNGLAVPFSSPTAVRADDVMKGTTGILRQICQDSHQKAQVTLTRKCCITSCLGLHHRSSYPVLTNVNSLSLCQSTASPLSSVLHLVNYSTKQDGKPESPKPETITSSPTTEEVPSEEKLSIFQRFKRAYKEHGKVLVAVHLVTSTVWFGGFYTLARGGVDIVPWMEQWGFSETVIKPFRAGGLGDVALAYLMYKLATPARYTVTLAGTNFVIRYRRSQGKMAPKSQEDSLRELYKEGRQKLKNSKLRQDRLKKLREARERRKAEKRRK